MHQLGVPVANVVVVGLILGRCHEHQKAGNQCFGGAARMMTKINEIRDKSPDTTLLLNAGDYYQGIIIYLPMSLVIVLYVLINVDF